MRSIDASGIELMSTKLITALVETCGNGKAGIRLPSTKTRLKFGPKPWRLIEDDPGEKLLPLVVTGEKLPSVEGKRCRTSVTVWSACLVIKS